MLYKSLLLQCKLAEMLYSLRRLFSNNREKRGETIGWVIVKKIEGQTDREDLHGFISGTELAEINHFIHFVYLWNCNLDWVDQFFFICP